MSPPVTKAKIPQSWEHSLSITTNCAGQRVTIVPVDNGPGLPDSVNPDDPPGFGLTMVNAPAEQLKATIRFERGRGTRVVLEFDA